MSEITSDVGIINLALVGHLGHDAISAIGEATKGGQLAQVLYESTRNACLRMHPWNFAVRRAELAEDVSETVPFEYDNRFTLPVDCLKVIRTDVEAAGYDHDYRIEGRFILTDESTVEIEYIAKIEDVSNYDPLFIEVLALQLAIRMCMRMTDNASLKATLQEELKAIQPAAQATDAQEGASRDPLVDVWGAARQ